MSGRYFPPEADLAAWLIGEGLADADLTGILDTLTGGLRELGIDLSRAYVGMPVVSPDLHAVNYVWTRGEGAMRRGVTFADHAAGTFDSSPFAAMMAEGETMRRFRLDGPPTGFSVLDGLGRAGATDHICFLVSFDRSGTKAVQGAAMSFTTDAAAGFRPFDVERLTRLVPLLGLAACRIGLSDLVTQVLDAYVGRDAGQRVLRGEMRRGEGHRRQAALLVADLSGFTAVADLSPKGLIPRLGRHLEAMVEPVEESGGEVSKFLGDGILAGWPADQDGTPETACRAALAAAEEALARNAALAEPGGELGLKVALHLGEVFYGNIGAGRRLDYTVIGPAVNETCRIETLCGVLGRTLLMSAPFAAACGRPTISLGHHALRHVREPREIFALAPTA